MRYPNAGQDLITIKQAKSRNHIRSLFTPARCAAPHDFDPESQAILLAFDISNLHRTGVATISFRSSIAYGSCAGWMQGVSVVHRVTKYNP